MKKRLISLLLVLCTLLTMLPMTVLANQADLTGAKEGNPFTDVKKWDWYYDAVRYVSANQIFNGVTETEFVPNGTMTRGMFVTVLGRMAGVDASAYAGETVFEDVAADAYYAPYVAWASRHGITTGVSETEFMPDALINRQQMAAFFARYFDAFDVTIDTDTVVQGKPADLDQVADWAKEPVLSMWSLGLLNGDGKNFAPQDNATRAQTATLCARLDEVVAVWYKEPGVESDRVKVALEDKQEEDKKEEHSGSNSGSSSGSGNPSAGVTIPAVVPAGEWSVQFYDGDRLMRTVLDFNHKPYDKGRLPTAEQEAKEGYVLEGYYLDPQFTQPFHMHEVIYQDINVYAKYHKMRDSEVVTFTTFTLLDQATDVTFDIVKVSGNVQPSSAPTLETRDGKAVPELQVIANGSGGYTVSAVSGFEKGGSYEMFLAEGWNFAGKDATVRSVCFTIYMEEVENLQMNEEILYVADTSAMRYTNSNGTVDVLTADDVVGEVTFTYTNADMEVGDILCIYTGKHPEQRGQNSDLLDPAVYVEVKAISGSTVTIGSMSKDVQAGLYQLADNFPFLIAVGTLPSASFGVAGAVSMEDFDELMYENMMGQEEGTEVKAREKLSVGDFVTLYEEDAEEIEQESDLRFGQITKIEGETIHFVTVSKQTIEESMDLYSQIDLTGEDLLPAEEQARLEASLQAQLEATGFAEEAAYMMADLVTKTEGFRNNAGVKELLLTDENGNELSPETIEMMGLGTMFELKSRPSISAKLINGGSAMHFKNVGSVQLNISVAAEFVVHLETGDQLCVEMSASFVEEVSVSPKVSGEMVTKEILWIPIPIGVQVNASIDVMNYTAMSFAAEIYTKAGTGNVIKDRTSVISNLDDIVSSAAAKGVEEEYQESLAALMAKYNEMLTKETDWIQIVDQEIFDVNVNYYGLVMGITADFVVRTDMAIAIGSDLEYEVGKRYSFWFKIGLFSPSAGSDTMDILDESFAFRFYVLGKLGVKAGVQAKLYVALGAKEVANVGITAEIGPYLKLYGFFLYEYAKYKPANTGKTYTTTRTCGAAFLEFGLYFMLGFEAEALDLFSYSHDFLDEELPLLTAGSRMAFYDMDFEAQDAYDKVYIRDDNGNYGDGISMVLPDYVRALKYVDLPSGSLGTLAMPWTDYSVTFSRPEFSFNPSTGAVLVNPKDGTYWLEATMTITYLEGKYPFSNYDMKVEVPVAWTTLSDRELTEYFTAEVKVGNVEDGYQTVWSKRVLRGQGFDLPDAAAIKSMFNWNDVRHVETTGYGSQQLQDVTQVTNKVYTYEMDYREYPLVVTGIQGMGATSRTFTVNYGGTYNFSDLIGSGTNQEGNYTIFTEVTATIRKENGVEEPLDLSLPIQGAVAKAIAEGRVTARANYMDNSVTSIFTFNGFPHEDMSFVHKKGTTISPAQLQLIVNEIEKEDDLQLDNITPDVNVPQNDCNNFVVNITVKTGDRAAIRFHVNPGGSNGKDRFGNDYLGEEVPDLVRLEYGYIGVLPTPERTGYNFVGWSWVDPSQYTWSDPYAYDPNGADLKPGELPAAENYDYDQDYANVYGAVISDEAVVNNQIEPKYLYTVQKMPVDGIDLYAIWEPKEYTINFHTNGEAHLTETDEALTEVIRSSMVVTYDTPFAKFSTSTTTLPRPVYSGNDQGDHYRFDGWWTNDTASDLNFQGQVEVRADTKVTMDNFLERLINFDRTSDKANGLTLFACWKEKLTIQKASFSFAAGENTVTYDRQEHHAKPTYALVYTSSKNDIYNGTDPYYNDEIPALDWATEFKLFYGDEHPHEAYNNKEGTPKMGGSYTVKLERSFCETYKAFYEQYPSAFKIEKATRTGEYQVGSNASVNTEYKGFRMLELTGNASGVLDVDNNTVKTYVYLNEGKKSGSLFYDLTPGRSYTATVTVEDRNYVADTSNGITVSTSGKPGDAWNAAGNYDTSWYSGSANSFEIWDEADLAGLAYLVNSDHKSFSGKTITLKADLDMNGKVWTPVGSIFFPFMGTFNGNGHTISGIYVDDSEYAGLFGCLGSDARIKDLRTMDFYIDADKFAGTIAGVAIGDAQINNCTSYGKVNASTQIAGGILGGGDSNDSGAPLVVNCVFFGQVHAGSRAGGIAGHMNSGSRTYNCANLGLITGGNDIGGVVGRNEGGSSEVKNCYSAGRVEGTGEYVGAAVGRNVKDDGVVHYVYYLNNSATCNGDSRNAVGTEDGSLDDCDEGTKTTFFYGGWLFYNQELGYGKGLKTALNAWANNAGGNAACMTWEGPEAAGLTAGFSFPTPTGSYEFGRN